MDKNINENLNNLWEKIKDVKVAMMTTGEKDGRLRSRPMYTQNTGIPPRTGWFSYSEWLNLLFRERNTVREKTGK